MVANSRDRLLVAAGNPASFGLHLLAYADQHPDDSFDLLMIGRDDVGTGIIRSAAERRGVRTVTVDEARATDYASVVVHSYAEPAATSALLSSLRFEEIWYYGDLLRNAFVFEPGTDLSRATLICFGWKLLDPGMIADLAHGPRDIEVVPLDAIRDLWREVGQIAGLGDEAVPSVGPHELLVVLRYWGVPPLYPTRRHDSLARAVADLAIPAGVTRLIVKPDWRAVLDADELIGLVAAQLGDAVEVVPWNEPASLADRLGSLNVLDFHLFQGSWITGHVSGFDGTPNVLVAMTQPDATVHWPRPDDLGRYFYRPEVVRDIRQTIALQQDLLAQFRSHGTAGLDVTHDGRDFRTMLRDALPVASFEDDTAVGALTRLASTLGLDADPEVHEMTLRVDGLRRDRMRYERLWREEVSASGVRDARIAELDAARAEWERSSREATAAATAARAAADAAELRLRSTTEELAEALARAGELAQKIDAMTASRSWTITAPLRRVGDALRRRR